MLWREPGRHRVLSSDARAGGLAGGAADALLTALLELLPCVRQYPIGPDPELDTKMGDYFEWGSSTEEARALSLTHEAFPAWAPPEGRNRRTGQRVTLKAGSARLQQRRLARHNGTHGSSSHCARHAGTRAGRVVARAALADKSKQAYLRETNRANDLEAVRENLRATPTRMPPEQTLRHVAQDRGRR